MNKTIFWGNNFGCSYFRKYKRCVPLNRPFTMDEDFEIFWIEYLRERDNYRDDAWENILRRKISDQPLNKQVKLIDALVDKCIERQKKYSDWAFETFDELANPQQIDRLKSYTTECILTNISFETYADLIVFFIKRDFEFIKQKARQIITTENFTNLWKYILKNIFFKDKNIFLTGLHRYLINTNELGFDIGTFIKHTPNARQLVLEKLADYKRFDTELGKY